jgi:hypothetical protein
VWPAILLTTVALFSLPADLDAVRPMKAVEKQVTAGPGGRILTHTGVWSPDSEWIVYDTRSDAAGEVFDGTRIEMVNIRTGEVTVIYKSRNDAHCGVVTFNPRAWKVVFILGPENPTPDWSYNAYHRQGLIVEVGRGIPTATEPQPKTAEARLRRALESSSPGKSGLDGVSPHQTSGALAAREVLDPLQASAPQDGLPGTTDPTHLDARDLTPPFTAGALRGGSHVHVWDAAGEWVSFTYEDHVLARFTEPGPDHDLNRRNLGVSVPGRPVRVRKEHPRNHDGDYFSVLVTRTTANPKPGSDEIQRAFEDAWVGTNGYRRAEGSRHTRALAFQGHVVTSEGRTIAEVFLVDLPEALTVPGNGPLAGTETRMPCPPKGTVQRRLTFTAGRPFPGLQGPRHWLRSAPDGSRIAFLMKDEAGIVQLWTVSPSGGPPAQLTRNPWPVASAFSWSPDGHHIAHVMDHGVCLTDTATGRTQRLTPRSDDASGPRPEACVFSPDGRKIAYVRRVPSPDRLANQICIALVP